MAECFTYPSDSGYKSKSCKLFLTGQFRIF
jgi:hypothetical protein